MKRIVIAFMLSCMTLFSSGVYVSAYNRENTISPYYLYTSTAECKLTNSYGTLTCESKLTGYYSVTKISATQYLEKKNGSKWETVDFGTWSDSVNDSYLSMSNSKGSLDSGTYHLRTVFTVYSGTKSETIEKISNEITI